MAVVLTEGFDHLTAAQMQSKGWTSNPTSVVAGRFDGQAWRAGPASVGFPQTTKPLPATYTTLIAGFAFRTTTIASTDLFALRAGTTNTARLQMTAGGLLAVANSGGTLVATGTTVLVVNTWYYIELKIFVNTGTPASGTCELHLNGASEIASTAGNFGSTALDHVAFGNAGTPNPIRDYDDLYILDTTGSAPRNTFLGDVRVKTIYPSADGAHTQWTPDSGASHFARVDEAQADDDTSYVSDATPGDLDTYTFNDVDGGATVYAVQKNLYARKDDAATRQIAPVTRQAGTDYVGTTFTLASSYLTYSQLDNQDPTGSDWTAAAVNGDEFGIKEIT